MSVMERELVRTRRSFTDEFKRDAVALVIDEGRRVIDVAGALGVARSRRSALVHHGDVPAPSPGRVLVEMQKVATRMHCAVLESPAGRFASRIAGHEFLVLRTTGRKSGLGRETPLSFTRDGGAFVVIASDGGAPRHPDWYRNLQANPHIDVVVGGKLIAARAETVTGPDRDRLWRAAVRSFPGYRVYQARTAREIPVLRLVPRAPSPGA